MPLPFQSVPPPPLKDDPRFDAWVKQLWQKVISSDIVENARNVRTTDTAAISTTETIVLGGVNLARIYANTLKVGTTIRVILQGTSNPSAANTSTFRVRFGTAGTTADTAIGSAVTPVSAAGANIPFRAEIVFTVRTVGATGTISGKLTIWNTGVTGIINVATTTVNLTVAAINTTVDNWLSITYQSAAGTTPTTFNDGSIEVVKP